MAKRGKINQNCSWYVSRNITVAVRNAVLIEFIKTKMAALMCRTSKFVKPIRFAQLRQLINTQTLAVQNDEDAHYPPIKPKLPPGDWGNMERIHAWMWHEGREEIAALKSAKEKIDHLTEGTYKVWNYKTIDLNPDLLNFQLKLTKTYLIDGSLPAVYDDVLFEDYDLLKKVVTESIIQELELNRERFKLSLKHRDENKPGSFQNRCHFEMSKVYSMNWFSNLLGILGSKRNDIFESHLDSNVFVSACWSRDGVLRKMPFRKPKCKNYIRHNNSEFYGCHEIPFQLRKNNPLPEVGINNLYIQIVVCALTMS